MDISKLRLENYRCISSGEFSFSDITVLIGRNNAGKSSVLEALEFYSRQYNADRFGNFDSRVRDRDTDKDMIVEVTYLLTDSEAGEWLEKLRRDRNDYSREDKFQEYKREGLPRAFVHKIELNGTTSVNHRYYILDHGGQKLSLTDRSDADGILGRSSNIRRRLRSILEEEIEEFVGGFEIAESERTIDNYNPSAHEVEEMAPDGSNVVGRMWTLDNDGTLENNEEIFNSLETDFISTIEDFEGINTGVSTSDVSLTFRDVQGIDYGIEEISDGSAQLSILRTFLTDALVREDSLLMIEEPELNLHPDAQRKVYRMMKDVVDQGIQILLTTHSNVFMNVGSSAEIVNVRRNGYTEFVTIDQESDESKRLVVESLGYNKSDVLFSDGVIFVEGESEVKIMREFFDKLGLDVERLLFEPIGELENVKKRGKYYAQALEDLDMPFLVIVDSHDLEEEEIEEKKNDVRRAANSGISNTDKLTILSGYGIEYYLCQDLEAVSSALNLPLNELREDFENKKQKDQAEWIEKMIDEYRREGETFDKVEDGEKIASEFDSGKIPEEIEEFASQVQDEVL